MNLKSMHGWIFDNNVLLQETKFKTELDKQLFARAPDAEMMSGAVELVQFLKKIDVPCAVATSATTEILERKTRRHFNAVYSFFTAMVAGDDPEVKKGKPAPDLLLVSAQRIGVKPNKCAYVGDNPIDVQAAIAAGMLSIAVPGSWKNLSEFSGAAYIFSDLGMLLNELKS